MSDSRSIKSVRNIITANATKLLSFVLAFVSRTVFIRVFGAEMLGLNGLFANVLSILSLADLGFSTAMTYSYYKPIAENDKKKIAALNHFYKKLYCIIAVAIAVVGLALIPFLKLIINLENEVDNLYIYYLITLANTVVSYLFVYKTTVLGAYQETYIVTKYSMIMSTISTVTQIILMLLFKNYIVYLSVAVFFTFINNVYVSHVADKRYPFIKEPGELDKKEKKTIFSNLKSIFLYKLSSVLMNSTDNIIISKIVGTVVVGYYSNYLTVINFINSFISSLFYSLTASIGNLMVQECEEKQYRIFKDVQVISAWSCMVVSSCVYVLINRFIALWIGDEFVMNNLTVIAIAINFFLSCLLYPIWIFREAAGIYLKTKYIMVVCALLNIVLSIIMGKFLGVAGILFASAISKLLTYIWYEPIILFKNFFKKSPAKFFASAIAISVLTVTVSVLLSYIDSKIAISGIGGFILSAIACFAASNIIYILVYCRNEYFIDVSKRIVNLLKGLIRKH